MTRFSILISQVEPLRGLRFSGSCLSATLTSIPFENHLLEHYRFITKQHDMTPDLPTYVSLSRYPCNIIYIGIHPPSQSWFFSPRESKTCPAHSLIARRLLEEDTQIFCVSLNLIFLCGNLSCSFLLLYFYYCNLLSGTLQMLKILYFLLTIKVFSLSSASSKNSYSWHAITTIPEEKKY